MTSSAYEPPKPFVRGAFAALAVLLFLAGCAASSGGLPFSPSAKVPVTQGRLELVPAQVPVDRLELPDVETLSRGAVFLFSPVEIPGHKAQFRWEGVSEPLGQSASLRMVGEGVIKNVPVGSAKSFAVRYVSTFDRLEDAQQSYPQLSQAQFRSVLGTAGPAVEVLNWEFRMAMILSRDRKAFRVLMDSVSYHHPILVETETDEPQARTGEIPVLVAFSYRYPDAEANSYRQQNVVFDYLMDIEGGAFEGRPQISNWVPLQEDAENGPYSIEISVAEITGSVEDLYPIIRDLVQGLRQFL